MKKLIVLLGVMLLLVLVLAGCDSSEPQEFESGDPMLLTGAIVIRDNWLYIDQMEIFVQYDGFMPTFLSDKAVEGVELLDTNDHERIAELGLDLDQFHSGHYIRHNTGTESLRFEITDETVFTFTDTALHFIEDDPDNNPRRIANVTLDDFVRYISESTWRVPIPPVLDPDSIGADTLTRRPYFVVVRDGRVVSVLEEFIFTQ